TCAAGRATWRSGEVIRILHLTTQRTDGDAADGKFLQVSLAKNERTSFPKSFDSESVLFSLRTFKSDGASRCGHVRGVKIIFQNDGDATQRLQFVGPLELPVHGIG